MPDFFSDNMDFQYQKPIFIRGTAAPDEMLIIQLDKNISDVTVNKNDQWLS